MKNNYINITIPVATCKKCGCLEGYIPFMPPKQGSEEIQKDITESLTKKRGWVNGYCIECKHQIKDGIANFCYNKQQAEQDLIDKIDPVFITLEDGTIVEYTCSCHDQFPKYSICHSADTKKYTIKTTIYL